MTAISLQIYEERLNDWLIRQLLICELSKDRTRHQPLPVGTYDNMTIRGDQVVVWSTISEDFTPISVWDSKSNTLNHIRSQNSYRDFTVFRHAGDTILLSGVNSLRTYSPIMGEHYDSQGTLASSQIVPCPKHRLLPIRQSPNEFSMPLISDDNDDTLGFMHSRFSISQQKITSARFKYNPTTSTMTFSSRRSRLP